MPTTKEMNDCIYCYRERGTLVQPHYTTHKLRDGSETWIAYCPVCGIRTRYTKRLRAKTIEQAKVSWNAYDFVGKVCLDDVPMQTFSPD